MYTGEYGLRTLKSIQGWSMEPEYASLMSMPNFRICALEEHIFWTISKLYALKSTRMETMSFGMVNRSFEE